LRPNHRSNGDRVPSQSHLTSPCHPVRRLTLSKQSLIRDLPCLQWSRAPRRAPSPNPRSPDPTLLAQSTTVIGDGNKSPTSMPAGLLPSQALHPLHLRFPPGNPVHNVLIRRVLLPMLLTALVSLAVPSSMTLTLSPTSNLARVPTDKPLRSVSQLALARLARASVVPASVLAGSLAAAMGRAVSNPNSRDAMSFSVLSPAWILVPAKVPSRSQPMADSRRS
jgi:hypothetical protein